MQTKETARLVALEAGWRRIPGSLPFRARACRAARGSDPRSKYDSGIKEKGHRGVFVQPIGFLCDHVEILYDIDIALKQLAKKEGMRLWRAESLNDSRLLTAALADVARSRVGK